MCSSKVLTFTVKIDMTLFNVVLFLNYLNLTKKTGVSHQFTCPLFCSKIFFSAFWKYFLQQCSCKQNPVMSEISLSDWQRLWASLGVSGWNSTHEKQKGRKLAGVSKGQTRIWVISMFSDFDSIIEFTVHFINSPMLSITIMKIFSVSKIPLKY